MVPHGTQPPSRPTLQFWPSLLRAQVLGEPCSVTQFLRVGQGVGSFKLRSTNKRLKSSLLNTKQCPLFDLFFDEQCPFHDPYPVEHENPGTNRRFLVKGVGSFSKGGGVLIGQKGGVSINSSASTSRRRDGVYALGRGTPSDVCDSVRIGSSGLRIECPIAPGTQ